MALVPVRSFDNEIRYVQQNRFLPVKDTKTFTLLIERKPCVEIKSAKGPTREAQNELESSIFMDIL